MAPDDVSTGARFPRVLLLATDGSADAALARQAATDLSARSGAALHLVHAWHIHMPASAYGVAVSAEYWAAEEKSGRDLLQRERGLAEAGGAHVAGAHLISGSPARGILDVAGEVGAGLVIIGSRGLGPVGRLVLGSVSEALAHLSHRPVLVLRGGEGAWPPRRLVVADDGSTEAEAATVLAAHVAALLGVPLVAVEVVALFQGDVAFPGMTVDTALSTASARLEERVAGVGARTRTALGHEVRAGDPTEEILAAAAAGGGHSLIAAGSRGHGALQRLWLGSVSTKLLHAAGGPLLIVPPADAHHASSAAAGERSATASEATAGSG